MGEQLSMSVFAIVQEYKLAKNKTQQIKILADENLCEQRQIAQILFDNGQRLPVNWYNKITTTKPRHRKDDPAQEPTMEPAGDTEPAAPPVAREELEQVAKQVADLQGQMEDTRQAVVSLCDSLVASANEHRKKMLTVGDVKMAAFDVITEFLADKDSDDGKRAGIIVATSALNNLLERLEAAP